MQKYNYDNRISSLRILYQAFDTDDQMVWVGEPNYTAVSKDGHIDYDYQDPSFENARFPSKIRTDLMINTVVLDDEIGLGFVFYGVKTKEEILYTLQSFMTSLSDLFLSEISLKDVLSGNLSSKLNEFSIVTGKQIGRASCRERVCRAV